LRPRFWDGPPRRVGVSISPAIWPRSSVDATPIPRARPDGGTEHAAARSRKAVVDLYLVPSDLLRRRRGRSQGEVHLDQPGRVKVVVDGLLGPERAAGFPVDAPEERRGTHEHCPHDWEAFHPVPLVRIATVSAYAAA